MARWYARPYNLQKRPCPANPNPKTSRIPAPRQRHNLRPRPNQNNLVIKRKAPQTRGVGGLGHQQPHKPTKPHYFLPKTQVRSGPPLPAHNNSTPQQNSIDQKTQTTHPIPSITPIKSSQTPSKLSNTSALLYRTTFIPKAFNRKVL